MKNAAVDIVTDHTGANRSPDDLPRVVVRTFTLGLATCWLMGAFFHVLVLIGLDLDEMAYPKLAAGAGGHGHGGHHAARLQMQLVGEVSWPDSARLFEASALHCHGSGILVGDRFGLYEAQDASASADGPGLGAFSLVARSAAATVCESGAAAECQVLLRWDHEDGTSQLASLEPGSGFSGRPMSLPIPGAWRLISAALSPARRCTRGAADMCRTVRLAGWDGSEITIADALEDSEGGWRVHERFAVHPRLLDDSRPAPVPVVGANGEVVSGGDAYADVVAMQLGSGGKTLTVMLATGILDGWELSSGEFLGQWHVGSHQQGPAAMCHDGRDLWLARRGGRKGPGPALERAPLPVALMPEAF